MRDGDCSYCWFNVEGECRRYPPVVTKPAEIRDGERREAEWGYPPAIKQCGEYE